MLSPKQREPQTLSDSVYAEIVDTLYATTTPITLAAWALAIIGVVGVAETGDLLLGLLTAIGLIAAFSRLQQVHAYRRRITHDPFSRNETAHWDRQYSIGANVRAAIFGLFAMRTFMLDCSTAMLASG